jgi:anti-sigma B factor antagonist
MAVGCTIRHEEAITILDLSGRLGLGELLEFGPGRHLALSDAVKALADEGHKKILLNLAEIKYVDSSGIGQMVGTLTTARSLGVELKMFSPAKQVLDLLKMTKLLAVFDVRENEASAVAAFSNSAAAGR